MQIGVGLYTKHIYKQLSKERTQEDSGLQRRMSVTYTCHVTSVSPQTRMWANAQRDGRPAEHRWHPVFQTAKFGWRPLLECRAVTLPSRETRLNLEGYPKLPNRSQPLVGRSSPYYQDMWRRYHCLTGFFRLSIRPLVAKIQPDKVVRWCRDGDFFASCISSEPRAARFRPAS